MRRLTSSRCTADIHSALSGLPRMLSTSRPEKAEEAEGPGNDEEDDEEDDKEDDEDKDEDEDEDEDENDQGYGSVFVL